MDFSSHKTKIICTVGPASNTVPVLEKMMLAGMNVARINFSHGDPATIRQSIQSINEASRRTGRLVTILADLPGTKIRVGMLQQEPLMLQQGESVTLTTSPAPRSPSLIPVEYERLPESVAVGGTIYMNDGFIALKVDAIDGREVRCTVIVGGPLRSRKGINLPGAHVLVDPVTPRDLELLSFGLAEGIDTFGLSFIEKAENIAKVRAYAKKAGHDIRVVAKIERAEAVQNIGEIFGAADAVMIARGDLGVETPIEDVPLIQKKIIAEANLLGRPVITATQMLESMKNNSRPTRAEVSDVANAIFDGTDALMLSEETAIGAYPVETVKMMAAIATAAERQRGAGQMRQEELRWYLKNLAEQGKLTVPDVISRNVVTAGEVLQARYILTPTDTGNTPRRVSRFKPGCWILAFSRDVKTCRFLSFSYGVHPFVMENAGGSWHEPILKFLRGQSLVQKGDRLILAEGRFLSQPGGTDSLEVLTVGNGEA
jgi:pyruvate kinase